VIVRIELSSKGDGEERTGTDDADLVVGAGKAERPVPGVAWSVTDPGDHRDPPALSTLTATEGRHRAINGR
jgi:hypothetical protein